MVEDIRVAKKLIQLKSSADSRGIEFNLTFKRVKYLLSQKRCYFTGVEFIEEEGNPHHRSIDRLDNSKGYTDKNTVACTVIINQKKDNLSIEEIKQIYAKIKHL